MNREIKFRVWDVENKEMLEVQELDFEPTFYGGRIAIRPDQYNDYFDTEDMILMQYTGLKDKNGKEIYEGDIVKAYFKKGAWKYNDKNYCGYKNGDVQYCVDGFILYIENYKEKIYPLSSFGDNDGNINELEVIGNIYDNPELLGGE